MCGECDVGRRNMVTVDLQPIGLGVYSCILSLASRIKCDVSIGSARCISKEKGSSRRNIRRIYIQLTSQQAFGILCDIA